MSIICIFKFFDKLLIRIDLKVTNESNERITTVPQVEEKSLRKKLLFNGMSIKILKPIKFSFTEKLAN